MVKNGGGSLVAPTVDEAAMVDFVENLRKLMFCGVVGWRLILGVNVQKMDAVYCLVISTSLCLNVTIGVGVKHL